MKKINILAIFVFIIFTGNLISQSGIQMSVFGYFLENATNKPLKGITISLLSIEDNEIKKIYESISDFNGYYQIDYLPKGKYLINVDLPDIGIINFLYMDNLYEIDVDEGKNKKINFFIKKDDFYNLERKESRPDNSIDYFLTYNESNNMTDTSIISNSASIRLNAQSNVQSDSPSYEIKYLKTKIVADDFVLPHSKNKKNGGVNEFIAVLDYDIVCNNNKCDFINVKITCTSQILIHRKEWFQKLANCTVDQATCIFEGALNHEVTHREIFQSWFEEMFNKFKIKLIDIEANYNVDCEDDCIGGWKDKCLYKFIGLWKNLLNEMAKQLHKDEDSLEQYDAVIERCL